MRSARVTTAILLAAATVLAARPEPQESEPLTAPYRPPRETVLAANGAPQAVVLIPEESGYAQAARDFVARFEKATRVRLPARSETDMVKHKPDAPALVVFGHAGTGPLALRLYANHLIGSDTVNPGRNGFEWRTIPFALDLGVNILFLGGSSPQAVAAAADAFFANLKPGPTVAVPYTVRWVEAGKEPKKPIADSDIEKRLASLEKSFSAARRNPYEGSVWKFIGAAQNFYFSGEDSYGRLAARLAHVLADYYVEHKVKPPTFQLHQVVMALDQVEESAGMTDADRLKAGEWVRRMVQDTMGFWEMSSPKRRYAENELVPTWNHQTFAARSVAYGAQYMKAHYRLPAADYWEAVVHHLFAGQITCDQPLEDSANYQWSVPSHTIDYVLATGRLWDYFANGSLRSAVEYLIASHDSMGAEAPHGDAWTGGIGSSAGGLLSLAATTLKDPRCTWLLERVRMNPGKGMWKYPAPIAAREPADSIGLRVFTVHPDRAKAYGIDTIPPERILDKAVFRSGWDTDADYLMLDGLSVGFHGQRDGNAIIRFVTQNRLWLVDCDYIRAAPKYHNTLAVVRNGVGPDLSGASTKYASVIGDQPFAAEHVCSAGTKDRGLIQSLFADYGGLDWHRNIFWKAGDFFVVIDTLKARSAADYTARAYWRTLGEARIEGQTLHVTQHGGKDKGDEPTHHFCIVNADGAALKLRERFDYGHGGDKGYYEKYPYAGKMTKVLVQTQEARLQEGEALRFANLFRVRPEAGIGGSNLRPCGKNAWSVGGERPAVVGLGPFKGGGLEVDAGLFLLTPEGLLTAGATRATPAPRTAAPATLSAILAELVGASQPAPSPAAPPTLLATPLTPTGKKALNAPVTALAADAQGVLCGTRDGHVVLLDRKGRPRWEKNLESRVRTVALARFAGGQRVCLAGTHKGEAQALDAATGEALWSYTCTPYHHRSGSVAVIFSANLDAEPGHEVVAGSDNHHVHALSAAGKLLWRQNTTHASWTGAAGDCDGDRLDEIAAGTEYYWHRVMSAEGKWRAKCNGGPGVSAVAIIDFDADGKAEALFGMEDGFARCIQAGKEQTKRNWQANVGGPPTAIEPLDLDADGKPEAIVGSDSGSVYALKADKSLAWRTALPDSVNDLVVVGNHIVAACDDGRVCVLDRAGTVLKQATLPEPPGALARTDEHGVVAAAGDTVYAFEVR
ncbi:MAG: PQQ-binding-like beta-propeller repeat protein [Kiritimatiellae bacterium]|nr:PQQ-binding-like beta-propeller repeat protein [Kiritimatiellia bacterium]